MKRAREKLGVESERRVMDRRRCITRTELVEARGGTDREREQDCMADRKKDIGKCCSVSALFSGYGDRLIESLEPQKIGHMMSVLQELGAWCEEDVSELKYSITRNNSKCAGHHQEKTCRFALPRERNGFRPIYPKIVERGEKHHLPSFSTESAALEEMIAVQ